MRTYIVTFEKTVEGALGKVVVGKTEKVQASMVEADSDWVVFYGDYDGQDVRHVRLILSANEVNRVEIEH